MGPPVYLDTNAVVQLVEQRHRGLRLFLERMNAAGRLLITSELTLAEVLVKPISDNEASLVTTYESLLTDDDVVQTVPVNRLTLRQSAEIRAALGGSLPDTIHVATAIITGCTTILSSDRRLKIPDGIVRIAVKDLAGDAEP